MANAFHKCYTRDAKIIILLFTIMPIMDTLNGIIEQMGRNFSVGILYRLLALLVLVYLTKGHLPFKLLAGLILLLSGMFILAMIHIALGVSYDIEIYILMTWLMFPLFLFFLYIAKIRGKINNCSIFSIINNYMWIVPATILIPRLLGVGSSTYQSGQGYKAFYHATNGISYFLGVLIIFSMTQLVVNFSLKSFLQMMMNVAACILVGTVSSIGSLALSVIIAVVVVAKSYPKFRKFIIIATVIFGVAAIVIAKYNSEELMQVYLRKMYFYNSGIYDSFIDFITSGRTVLFKDSIERIKETDTMLRVSLIGQGMINHRECELDYLDFCLQYGALGILLWSPLLISINSRLGKHASIVRVMIIFSLFYAGIVGHIFTNAMSAMLFALILCTDSDFGMELTRRS